MDHELEAERCIQAELFMNQATRGQDQGDPPSPPPTVHQAVPLQPNPANPEIMNEYITLQLGKTMNSYWMNITNFNALAG